MVGTGLKGVLVYERSLGGKIKVCLRVQVVDGYGFPNAVGEFECRHRRPDGKVRQGKQDSDQANGGEPADHVGIASQHEIAHPGLSNDPFTSNSIRYVCTFGRGHGSKVTMGIKKTNSNTCNHRSFRFVLKKWLG
jgi:hypothetical protein